MDNKIKLGIAAAIIIAVIATSIPLSGALSSKATSTSVGSSSTGASVNPAEKKVIRIGYFPNINHAQAVIGLGNGDFQKAFGDNVEIKTVTFNAGPSAIEGLFANQVDVTYVGPNPTIN